MRLLSAIVLASAVGCAAATSQESPSVLPQSAQYHVVKTIDLGPAHADYIIIDDQDNRGLVRNGTLFDLRWADNDGWVVDMRTGKLITQTMIGDGLESGVTDGRGRLLASIEDKGAIERLDTRSLEIEETYPVPGPRSSH